MKCSNSTLPEQRRHWGRIRPFILAIFALIVVLGIITLTALHYRFHVLWKYEESRRGLGDVQAVPDYSMPESPTPNGWVRCRVGCIEFSLPHELASNEVAEKRGASSAMFQHAFRAVVAKLFTDAGEFSGLLNTASELSPKPQCFTMPQFRRECYQASSDDFSWSMTPDEVRWHAFCITTSKLIRSQSDGHTESLFCQDLDVIIHFCGNRGVLTWQSKDCMSSGYMHLIDNREKVDPTWIRAVCQSLKLSNEAEAKEQEEKQKGYP